MAGDKPTSRKPRKTARRDGSETWEAYGNSNYRWEPFKEGHKVNQTHGAGTTHLNPKHRGEGPSPAALELASQIEKVALDHLGGACPPQLTMPQFQASVQAWARTEARAKMISDWLDQMDVETMTAPVRKGAQKSPVEIWLMAETRAERARTRLGLDPASWASIQRDLGFAAKAQEDAIGRLGQAGQQIVAERQAQVLRLPAERGGESA